MTRAERDILAIFRRFRVGPNKMLCLNNFIDDKFLATMDELVKNKLVVKDRPKTPWPGASFEGAPWAGSRAPLRSGTRLGRAHRPRSAPRPSESPGRGAPAGLSYPRRATSADRRS